MARGVAPPWSLLSKYRAPGKKIVIFFIFHTPFSNDMLEKIVKSSVLVTFISNFRELQAISRGRHIM